jgi:hypothetical protein
VRGGFCDASGLGRFILDLPTEKSIENTTFWSARVAFPGSERGSGNAAGQGRWINLGGSPPSSRDERTSAFRRDLQTRQAGANPNPSPPGLLEYHEPIQYLVRKTGYYCVGMLVYRL